MSALDVNTLMDEAKCYACYDPGSVPELAKLALLNRTANPGLNILASLTSSSASAVYATNSFTPAPNTLILACIATQTPAFGNAAPTSVVGNGLTWVQAAARALATDRLVVIYRTMGAAPTAGPLTITFAGSQSGLFVQVIQFTNVDTSGANGAGAVRQTGIGSATSATASLNITPFGAFNASGLNTGFFFAIGAGNPFAGTPKTNWTEGVDTGFLNTGAITEFRKPTTDNDPTVTMSSRAWAALGVEVQAA